MALIKNISNTGKKSDLQIRFEQRDAERAVKVFASYIKKTKKKKSA